MRNIILGLAMSFIILGCAVTQEKIEKKKVVVVEKKITKTEEIKKVKEIVVDINTTVEIKKEEIKKEDNITKEIDTIAVVFPSSTIGKYALDATNSINTFLLYKNNNFKLQVYDIVTENQKNIFNVFDELKSTNITKVILMLTKDSVNLLNSIDDINNIKIYLPLINIEDYKALNYVNDLNLTFGGISYEKQFEKLIEYSKSQSLIELYDNSAIGRALHSYVNQDKIVYKKEIDNDNGRYKRFLKNTKRFYRSTVILNTPIVKSSILLSAMNALDLNVKLILSSQLNYTPLLLSLTQEHDRRNIIIANSIGKLPIELQEYSQLMGNNISYSWVNYSIVLGMEYLLTDNLDLFEDISIQNNQVFYPIELYEVRRNSFKKL